MATELPISFRIRFSEPVVWDGSGLEVTGTADITGDNFTADEDGRTYHYAITEATPGTIIVTVPAGIAVDLEGHANHAARTAAEVNFAPVVDALITAIEHGSVMADWEVSNDADLVALGGYIFGFVDDPVTGHIISISVSGLTTAFFTDYTALGYDYAFLSGVVGVALGSGDIVHSSDGSTFTRVATDSISLTVGDPPPDLPNLLPEQIRSYEVDSSIPWTVGAGSATLSLWSEADPGLTGATFPPGGVGHDGLHTLHVSLLGGNTDGIGISTDFFDLEPGNHAFSGWLSGDFSSNCEANLLLRCYGPDPFQLGNGASPDLIPVNGVWQEMSGTYEAPAGTTRAKLEISVVKTDNFTTNWFDDSIFYGEGFHVDDFSVT